MAYRDLLVAAPVSVTSIRDPDGCLGGARRGRAHGPAARGTAGAGEHRRRRLGWGQPRHPDRARDGHRRRPARGDRGQVRLPARLRRGAWRRRAGSSTTAPSTSPARPAATRTTSCWPARLAPPPVAAELCLPLVRTGGHVLLWTADIGARAACGDGGSGWRRAGGDRRRGTEPAAGAAQEGLGHPGRLPAAAGNGRQASAVYEYDLAHERPCLRPCQPEGRRRQDDDGHQHGRVRRGGGHSGAPDRPRSAGERDHGARIPAGTALGKHVRPAPRPAAGRGRARDERSQPVPGAVASRPGRGPGRAPERLRPGHAAARPARRHRGAVSLRLRRLPAVARPPDRERAGCGEPPDRARAVRVLRARGPRAAAPERRAGAHAASTPASASPVCS